MFNVRNRRVLLFVRTSNRRVMNVPFFGVVKHEMERIFELVFNFSTLTTPVIGAIHRVTMNRVFNEIL